MRRLTTKEFIEKSTKVHNGKYSYEKSEYLGRTKPIIIHCQEHGYFEQSSGNHMSGHGCGKCSGNVQYTKETFIQKANNVHNNKYNYEYVIYTGIFNKVNIECLVDGHGIFEQTPDSHINQNAGCPKCSNNKKLDKDYFIEKVTEIHNGKYSYENVIYDDRMSNVEIICPTHGSFLQKPREHLNGSGCQECAIEERAKSRRGTLENFINKARKVHGNRYSYDNLCVYVDYYTKLKILCNVPGHGYFEQIPEDHINGRCGCPKCNYSKGEESIHEYLLSVGIFNTPQFSFIDCRNKYPLPFDFYVECDNRFGLIEFQGKQHYEITEFFGGQEAFEYRKYNDSIKAKYCEDKNIPLLLIHYNDIKKVNELVCEFIETIKISGKNI